MRTLREWLRRIQYLLRRRRFDDDLAEEMAFHHAMRQEEIEADGLAPHEAAARARRAIGNDLLAADRARDVWISPWLQDVMLDLRFAARLLAKDRRFALSAVLALGLGIGATNTVFTLVNALLIRDLPFERADRLVTLRTRSTIDAAARTRGLSYPDYLDWRADAASFEQLGASTHGGGMVLSGEQHPAARLRGQYVSANLFRLLRRAPVVGRDFLPEDERPGAPAVVMLGYDVWQARYGGDPTIVGRAVKVNDAPATIVGVMPPGFRYSFTTELWMPISHWPELTRAAPRRDARGLDVIGRLADKRHAAQAGAELEAIAAGLARAYPDTNAGIAPLIEPMNQGAMRATWPMLMTLMGAVGFVLLIACANVANLLLARAVRRGREIAIRASLGATRARIVRQLLIECLLLATIAGAVGLAFSIYGARFLGVAFDAREIAAPAEAATPYWVNLSIDGPALLFLTAVILATSLLFGLLPAWHVSQTNTNALLKEDGRGSTGSRRARRLTSAFMIAEIALTLVLLTGAGLLARSFLALYYADYRVERPASLVIMRVALPDATYQTPDRRARLFAALHDRLSARPALASAVIASDLPFEPMGGAPRTLEIEGGAPGLESDGADRATGAGARGGGDAQPSAAYVYTSERYFETLGVRAVRGRTLQAADAVPGHEGAVVSARFAARFFGAEDPIGRRIRLSPAGAGGSPPAAAAAQSGSRSGSQPASPAGSPSTAAARPASGSPRSTPAGADSLSPAASTSTSASRPPLSAAMGAGAGGSGASGAGGGSRAASGSTASRGASQTGAASAATAAEANAAAAAAAPWLTIVGIVPDFPRTGPQRTPEPIVYAPLRAERAPAAAAALMVRGDPSVPAAAALATVTAALREEVRALDADLPVYSVETMDAVFARARGPQVLLGGFLGAIALIALVLAAVGLHALTAHGVAQRTQEIGIRMALGARAPQVVWLFTRRTLLQLAAGLAIGLGGALAVGKLLQSLLVQTPPRDPLTLLIVCGLLISVALAAACLPALRAARLDPIAALRDD